MEKIFWLTSDNFIDVDLPIIKELSTYYDIHWCIYISKSSNFFTPNNIYQYLKNGYEKVNISIINSQSRYRSINTALKYINIAKNIRKGKFDIVYIDMLGMPYMFIIFRIFHIKNLVYACHDFIDHLHIKKRGLIKYYKSFIFKNFQNFQLFSQSQHQLFKSKYKNKHTFQASLCLKDFGPSMQSPPDDKIIFTFFGTIRENKGLNYLIEAGNILASKYKNQFIIRIYGYHNNWESTYASHIKDYSIFDLNIQHIPNEDIPNLMSSTHYIILPYLDVTQSGPLLIAYNYKTPVIASDLPGFKEYIQDKKTGFLFEAQNSKALADIMANCIDQKERYTEIKESLTAFVNNKLTTKAISQKYIEYFDTFNKNKR